MPSIRHLNQSAPFWDFVANLEDQGSQHPFFSDRRGDAHGSGNPWTWAWGPPPPHGQPPHHGQPDVGEGPSNRSPSAPENNEEKPHPTDTDARAPPQEGAMPHRPHPHHRGGCGKRRARHGSWAHRGAGGPEAFINPLAGLGALLGGQLFGEDPTTTARNSDDFTPDADVFDTESAFIVHISLPGAKKEDVGVNWDAEKSELSVGGVIYRPGDEDFLKTLALDERKVGAFQRNVRLGSRAQPAKVDADAITAKLEDGVLRVEVPKEDRDYVEIKKVDIE